MTRILKLALISGMSLVSVRALAQDNNAPAAAPAPADATAAPAAATPPPPPAEAKKKGGGPGLSLSPEAPQVGGLVVSPAESPVVEQEQTSEWKFDVTGYFRAPLRFSWGPPTAPDPNGGNAGTQIRTPPLVPDANYVDWRYTNSLVGPWTELNFHYGNDRAKATVQIASYNITDSGYRRLEANLGINQAFLEMKYPEVGSDDLHLTLIAGAFTNRYGAAGRYDGGKYETYLFGRTHVAGETANLAYDWNDFTVQVEQTFGGKLEPIPFYGPPGGTNPNTRLPPWEPYPGPVAQEPTFVASLHGGLSYKRQVTFGAHYIDVFANGNELSTAYTGQTFNSMGAGTNMAAGGRPSTDPKPELTVWGFDLKWLTALYGDGYIGYSHLSATNALYLADAIEVLHSFGGWQLHDNFFGPPGGTDPVTGSIDSIEFQEVFSFGQLFHYPQAFWGDGPDIIVSVFGMFNKVHAPMNQVYDGIKKLKVGAEVTYMPIAVLGVGGRYDLVRPDLSNPDTTDPFRAPFSVFSPRIILRTAFVTHEQVMFQYSRYFYANTVAASMFPYNTQPGGGGVSGADKNAFTIAAIIWF